MYGAFGADGIFLPREDLGGAAALQAGVQKIHAMGRRIQLYVSADIVHGARFWDGNLQLPLLFDPTLIGLKLAYLRVIQHHATRVFTLFPVDTVNSVQTLKELTLTVL